jgi:hypothetical protein
MADRFADLNKCISEKTKKRLGIPAPSQEHQSIFPTLSEHPFLMEISPETVTIEYNETTAGLLRVCSDLREYSKPNAPESKSVKNESSKAVQQ